MGIGPTHTIGRNGSNKFAVGSSHLRSDLLELGLNFHHTANEIDLRVGLIEADVGDDFPVVDHQGDLD